MFYYISDDNCDLDKDYEYRFVYNTDDKSVKLVSVASLKKLVKNSMVDVWQDFYYTNNRLYFYGFTLHNDFIERFYRKELFHNNIDGVVFTFVLNVEMYGFIKVLVEQNGNNKIKMTKTIDGALFSWYCWDYWIEIPITHKMMVWILNLYSQGDFNGIMSSFSNMLGSDIYKLINELSGTNVCLLEWC